MIETFTAIVAAVGAAAGLLNTWQTAQLRGRVDTLTGRVDALESVMQTIMTALIGPRRPAA